MDQGTQHGSAVLSGYRVSHWTAAGTAYPYFWLCPCHTCERLRIPYRINMVADICRLSTSLSFFETGVLQFHYGNPPASHPGIAGYVQTQLSRRAGADICGQQGWLC